MVDCGLMFQDTVCSLLSRTSTTHLQERDADPQRLEKKDERGGEATSER